MKITTTPIRQDSRSITPGQIAETSLISQIFQDPSGKRLIKFCRELSTILIRSYTPTNDIGEMRDRLSASLMVTLNCSEKQALSLIELALELVHAKVHGIYKRSEVEISYLIATASGAVVDLSAN